jgi:hypothetical protein
MQHLTEKENYETLCHHRYTCRHRLFAEAWPVEVNPVRFRSDEARMRLLGRTAGILGDLEAAVCRELGTDDGGEMPRRRAEDRAESAVNARLGG